MKRFCFSIRSVIVPLSLAMLVAVTLAACTKFDNDDDTGTPVSGLMAFNLAPDKARVGIAIGGNNLTSQPLAYTNFTGTYQRVFSGNRDVEAYDVNADTTIATATRNFESNKYYSVFVVGANGSYTNVVTHDNFDSLSSAPGKSYVRYINAIPDSAQPTVTISANGSDVVNAAAAFQSVSDFVEVTPGQVAVSVKNNAGIDANRSIELQSGKVYTVLLIGIPGDAGTDQAVQIKYIENGSLTAGQ